MIVKIRNNTEEYVDAYHYIKKTFPSNLHLHSAFSGTVFDRTIKILQHDVYGEDYALGTSAPYVDRIAFYLNDEIRGVAISATFSEFMHVLDYEEYIIIVADDIEAFTKLYDSIRTSDGRFEIITFREKERCFLRKIVKESEIHYWRIYDIGLKESDSMVNLNYFPFSMKDIENLQIELSNENSPVRYYHFSMRGMIEYKVWTLYDEVGVPILVASVMPYIDRVAEIKILIIEEQKVIPLNAAQFLKKIIYDSSDIYDSAVIRVKNEGRLLRNIIKCGKFSCISEEQHIHCGKG